MDNQQVSTLTPIPDLSGYFHDGHGNIYSTRRGKLKKLSLMPHGGKTRKVYYRVKVENKLRFVHRLVASCDYGSQIPSHLHVNHKDGDTTNNTPDNLEVVTHYENAQHAKRTGLYCSGQDWYKARGR